MFNVVNPYDKESVEKHRNKLLSFDQSAKNWFNFSIKRIFRLSFLRYLAIIILIIILLAQLALIKSVPVEAQNNVLDHWTISEPGNQTAGIPFMVTVSPKDLNNNTIVDYDWSEEANKPIFSGLANSPLGNSPAYIYQSDNDGVANYAVSAYLAESGARITATGGENQEATGSTQNPFAIVHNKVSGVNITPNSYMNTAGQSAVYSANAHDIYGNSWDVTQDTVFSIVENGNNGTWNNNIYASYTAGTWTVKGSYLEFIGNALFNVIHGKAKIIKIKPHSATAISGDNVIYTSKATDNFNNSWDVTTETDFSIDKKAGGTWSANIYESENIGNWSIIGTYKLDQKISDLAFLNITAESNLTSGENNISSMEKQVEGEVAGAEIGEASSVGPEGEVMAEESTKKSPKFSKNEPKNQYSSSAGYFPEKATLVRDLSIFLMTVGAIIILIGFLTYGNLTSSSEPAHKTRKQK